MNWVDVVIIIALVVAAVSGWRQGLVPALALLIALFLGLAVASRFGENVGSIFLKGDDSAWLLGFAIILIIAIVAGIIVGGIVQRAVHLLFLEWADRIGGLIFSVLMTMLFLSAIVVVIASIETSPHWLREGVKNSALASQMAASGEWLRPGWSWAQEKLRIRLPAF